MAPRGKSERVTIRTVAEDAGVSVAAVSKVLRDAYGVSEGLRAKVQATMQKLGYRPHAAARGMRGQTYTLGFVIPDLRNPFFADILDGITEQLGGTDYQVLMAACCNDEPGEARITEAMIDRSMDGVILIAPISSRRHLQKVARTVPTVVIGRHGHSPDYDTVTDDDFAGAGLVVDHLVALGHQRIAHIEHAERDPVRLREMPNAQRADGYLHAMRAHGLSDYIDIASTTYTQRGGYLGAQQLLARPTRPTAIFAGADIVAMGVLDALTEAGLSAPGDISLAGYDDTMFAAFGPISLTTVDQAGHQMGANAARLLLERITDPAGSTAQVKLSPTLVTRRTTAALTGEG